MPIEERGSFIARAVMGSTIGMVVNFPLCALLIESLGWESAFYIIGASTLVWGRTIITTKTCVTLTLGLNRLI